MFHSELNGEFVFETQRLVCRRWLSSDLNAIEDVYGDPVGARWVGDGVPISHADSQRWLSVTADNYRARGYGMYALVEKTTADADFSPLGFCGLVHPDGQPETETKYAMRKERWGRGFASEALLGLLNYAFSALDQQRLIATVAAQNLASQRVLVKCGFQFSSAHIEIDGESTFLYQILAAEQKPSKD